MRIGVDLGGTKIEAIALGADGSPLQRRRVPTPRGDYAATLRAIVTLVHHLERDLGQGASVGVGIPGALSTRTARVKNANSTWLIGKALDDDLATLLGRPVRVSNDANCFALSEASDGAGAGSQVVFGVIIGTGTGGGLVINGHVLTGLNAIAGEWGHNPLPWPDENELPGPPCYCGKRGCIETFLSGPGLTGDHHAHGGHGDDPMAINALAERGDPLAEASLRRYERRLAKALATVINILDPDVIVLGGGVSNLQRLYRNVPQLWCEYVFSDVVDTLLVPAKHGDSSGVRGAAWLWE
ncbi:MAG: hypothetical protein AMJ69_01640 [Gammaproteobacteria bacterium SG8_47]|nr:MAG: hypothetical protein AMJ69_01640 [Gammaproteobacteria bacterium SG8_47]